MSVITPMHNHALLQIVDPNTGNVITSFSQCDFELTLGKQPSTFFVGTRVGFIGLPQIVTCVLWYNSLQIAFTDCFILNKKLNVDSRYDQTLQILDRRWEWELGAISGRYNIRTPNKVDEDDEDAIYPETKKNPRELATLLLDAMGESGYEISNLPDDTYPEMEWLFANPAEELESLCQKYSCNIAITSGTSSTVSIVKLGTGAELPVGGKVTKQGLGTGEKPRPTKLKIVGAPIVFQERFYLEPIGLDEDDQYKSATLPTASGGLSYRPAGGFKEPLGFSDVFITDQAKTQAIKKLAEKSVFKMYRIKQFASTAKPMQLEYDDLVITDIKQVLPLLDGLIEEEIVGGVRQAKEPVVYATYHRGDPANPAASENRSQEKYTEGYTIDNKRGIVKFNKPLFRKDVDGNFTFAEVWLDVAFNLHDLAVDPDAAQKMHFVKEYNFIDPDSPRDRYVAEESLELRSITKYANMTTRSEETNNFFDLDNKAVIFAEKIAEEYVVDEPKEVEYSGLIDLPLDGKLRAVKWHIGPPFATTTVSYEQEPSYLVSSAERIRRFRERRFVSRAIKQQLKEKREL